MNQYGPIRAYYADLTSGGIAPEDLRIESLPYRATIDAAGQVIPTSPNTGTIDVVSRYNFVLRKIFAWFANPDLAGFAPALVTFQVSDVGRNFSVFKRRQFMQSYVTTSGPCSPHEWDGCFITVPGSTIQVDFAVDLDDWAALVGAPRIVGVDLVGDYVACGQPPAPTGG